MKRFVVALVSSGWKNSFGGELGFEELHWGQFYDRFRRSSVRRNLVVGESRTI